MSTRRAARASRATRTTRRTVEQQQHLQLDFSSGDAYGVLTGGDAFLGGGGPQTLLPSSSALGGGGPGGFGFGGASSSGAYDSHRHHFSRGKPARKWIRVRRPPAAGVGFRVDAWVPADQLTEIERAAHLPPSAKPSEDVFAGAGAGAVAPSLPVGVEAAKRSDGGVDDAVDAAAPSLMLVSEPGTSAPNSDQTQGPEGHDHAMALSVRPANEDVEMETAPLRETAAAAETDPTSPNDRPAKRARFAHEEGGTRGHGDASGSEMESRPGVASSTNQLEDAGVETSSASRASAGDVAGEAPAMPPRVGETSADAGSAEEASVGSAVPPSQSAPASEALSHRPSADSDDHSRKRGLAEGTSTTDRLASNDAEEPVEGDGPPVKRARASVDDDIDDAVGAATGIANDAPSMGVMAAPAKSAELPAAGSGATSNVGGAR